MRARELLAGGLVAVTLGASLVSKASAWDYRRGDYVTRAHGPTRLGPWVHGPWDDEWRAVGWAYDASLASPYPPTFVGPYPPTDQWYPWGYVAPFVRVGRKCVANEINVSPGGDYVRYQRVRPAYYCGT